MHNRWNAINPYTVILYDTFKSLACTSKCVTSEPQWKSKSYDKKRKKCDKSLWYKASSDFDIQKWKTSEKRNDGKMTNEMTHEMTHEKSAIKPYTTVLCGFSFL